MTARTCQHTTCNTELTVAQLERGAKYCCKAHKFAANSRKQEAKRTEEARALRGTRKCDTCGSMYSPSIRHQRYCRKECRPVSTWKKQDITPIACAVCGVTFQRKSSSQKACSRECANARYRQRWREECSGAARRASGHKIFCDLCGTLPHRVTGESCEICGTKYAPLPPIVRDYDPLRASWAW